MGGLLEAAWAVLVASSLILKPSWRILELSRAVWGGLELALWRLEPVFGARSLARCGARGRGDRGTRGVAARGPGPGISHICILEPSRALRARLGSSQAQPWTRSQLHVCKHPQIVRT